ncbi:MAG: adenylyltransferase/cytidyltransferase family protein [Chlamydiota bacterium]|nr:adenylyltransferase/cytidyltransferase family protein [Chlamydiota bacterium]
MQYWKDECKKKIIEPSKLEKRVAEIRSLGSTIVSLNGSFDLFHPGHLQILYEASLQGDVLIVALNSDTSIKSYKSPSRPIIPLEQRMQLITALEFVDFVTWFDDTTPISILEKIKPDVHVNGADYGENCIELETVKRYGGTIHLVEIIPGLSTTNIIKKIKHL